MADGRYATNAFTNFSEFENGTFVGKGIKSIGATEVVAGDNPEFLYPPNSLRTASGKFTKDKKGNIGSDTHVQPIQRGYMRMITQGFAGGSSLARKRLHFQFNPDSIVRSVAARNDVQLWMNQDPVQLMQPIPGDMNFAFELLFNREAEVVSGNYKSGGQVKTSTGKAQIPLGQAGSKTNASVPIPHSAVTDIGVLADLMVFDEIIGQGINTQLIDKVIANANAVAASKKQTAAATKSSTTTTPTTTAEATVTELDGTKIKTIKVSNGGTGYVSAPTITLLGGGGSGAILTAVVANGKVTSITVVNGGTGFTANPAITFTGGGDGTGTSADGTSDAQDAPKEFNVDDAYKSVYNNFGNSAFLVSMPIRIVFSSLFMVEGYITSTIVNFNKFNANMVPTQCSVGIQMQALYIGFARKDTFLTLTLTEGLKAANDALAETGKQSSDPEIVATESLGNNLFKKAVEYKTSKGTGSSGFDRESKEESARADILSIFNPGGDLLHTIGIRFSSTDALKNYLKQNSIKSIKQISYWNIVYMGNTNSGTPTGNSTNLVKGESIVPPMEPDITEFNLGDLKDGKDMYKVQFERAALPVGTALDTTSTSQYDITFTIDFEIETTSGSTVHCDQKFVAKGRVVYNQSFDLVKRGSVLIEKSPVVR